MKLLSMRAKSKSVFERAIVRAFPPPVYLSMPAVGIDISDQSVKFLEFVRGRKGLRLGRFGERKIPDGVVVGGEIKDVSRLAKILHAFKKDYKFSFARLSLPEEKAYLFQTTVPNDVSQKEIHNILEFKLEENVPVPVHEAVFDYEIIGPHTSHKETHIDIGVSVYTRETVVAYREVCTRAGLVPVSFEVEAQATARSVIEEGDDSTYMIIDFGRARTGVSVISAGVLRFTATLEIGGHSITDAITTHLNISEDEADIIKNEKGFLKLRDNDKLFMVLMSTVTELRDEIHRHMVFWNTRKDDTGAQVPVVEKIILSGGNSNLAGLPEYLEANLKVPVVRADVWRNAFTFEEYIPEIDYRNSLGYATAVGLALRSMG